MLGFGKPDTESVDEFWKKTAEKRGGDVGLITFATYVGRSGTELLMLAGVLYTVGRSVWFEDFDRDNWFARLIGQGKKWEKTEMGFPKSDVSFVRVVSKGSAYRCVRGALDQRQTQAVSPLARFFSSPSLQIGLVQGHSLFFEVLKQKELVDFLT